MTDASGGPARTPSAGADMGKRGGQRKRGVWNAVFVVAIIVLVASLVALGVIWFSYYQGQQKYDELAGYADFTELGDDEGEPALSALNVDWDALRAVNPDIVAWVFIPGTSVNYPVVRGADNEYYLTHDFDGDQGWLANYGAIFMDCGNNPQWTDDAYFIYGHHMNDGSMFADIAAMSDQGRFDSSRTAYLLSPQGDYKLRTFSLVRCAADEPIVQLTFETPEAKAAYVQDKIDRSIVQVGLVPEAASISKCFVFATCDNYDEGRYMLFAYVEDTTADGLVGEIGASPEEGVTAGLVG